MSIRVSLVASVVASVVALGLPALARADADADVTIAVTGGCSLANAIVAAQTGAATGGCPAGTTSALNTITLPAGTYDDHDLSITSGQIAIVGQGSDTTVIDAGSLGRAFDIGAAATVTIEALTIEHGLTPGGGTDGDGGAGGAIANAGTLTIQDADLSQNRTGDGGTGAPGTIGDSGGSGGSGGAVDNEGTLTILDSTLSDNVTGDGGTGGTGTGAGIGGIGGEGGGGGAVFNSGSLTITGSTLSDNITGAGGTGGSSGGIPGDGGDGGTGGAVWLESGTATIAGSDVEANVTGPGGYGAIFGGNGGSGGGVETGSGSATVTGTTIAINETGAGGPGGAGSGSGGDGGGIDNSATLTVSSSTLSGNAAGGSDSSGGGISTFTPPPEVATLSDSTLAGNSSGSGEGDAIELIDSALTIVASTVAGNDQTGTPGAGTGIDVISGPMPSEFSTLTEHDTLVAGNGAANCALDTHSTLTSLGHNLSYPDTTCAHEVTGDPRLSALVAAGGGGTATMVPGPGSAAIDQVPATDSACAGVDQRGVARPVGAGCDIGAVEVTPALAGTPTVTVTATTATIGVPISAGTTTTVQTAYGSSPSALTATTAAQSVTTNGRLEFTITGLAPSTAYTYEVTATSPFGSLTGAAQTFTTLPSSVFRILSVAEDRHDRLVIALAAPGAGSFTAAASYPTPRRRSHAASRPAIYGTVAASAQAAGTIRLTLSGKPGAVRALRAARSLRLTVTITFTPTGGPPATQSSGVTVRYRGARPPRSRSRSSLTVAAADVVQSGSVYPDSDDTRP